MNRLDGFRSSPWIDAIGWALLHSLWEGAAVALALACVLGLLQRASSQVRYLAACAAMVLLIALPAFALRRSEAIVSNATVRRALDRASPRFETSSVSEPDDASGKRRPWNWVVDVPRPFFPAVVASWAAGIALCSLRLLGGWVQARRWVRLDTRPLEDCLIDRLSERMGVRRRVALLKSARVEVPMVVGWVRPAILVPVAALSGLTAPELEAILAHELAHIRRHDYLVNVLQCVIESLMFYHPATWWISRVIRREREHCCDDIAVSACRDRLVYARALTALEGLRVAAYSPFPAASGGNLLARIRRILNPMEEPMKPVRILVAIFAALALVPIWLVRAGDQTETDPGRARSELVRRGPFPNRSFADIVIQIVEDAPTGRSSGQCFSRELDHREPLALLDATRQSGGPQASPALPTESPASNSLVYLTDDAGATENPPSESEIWARVPPVSKGHARSGEVQRNNVRIEVEQIANKTDPVKVYPLVGPCQLVHRHYKSTVHFDEVFRADDPTSFSHVIHNVVVVYIDKDFLRRAVAPGPPEDEARDPNASDPGPAKSRDDRIDRIVREIEKLRRELQSDRQDQERVIDRLIKELESLKKHAGEAQSARR